MESIIKTIDKRGRIFLPKKIRDDVKLTPGCKVEVINAKYAVVIMRHDKFRKFVSLVGKKVKDIDEMDIFKFIFSS